MDKTYIFGLLFCSKMCVICMFYVDWELEGQKNFRVGIYLSRVGLQETNNFLGLKISHLKVFQNLVSSESNYLHQEAFYGRYRHDWVNYIQLRPAHPGK